MALMNFRGQPIFFGIFQRPSLWTESKTLGEIDEDHIKILVLLLTLLRTAHVKDNSVYPEVNWNV